MSYISDLVSRRIWYLDKRGHIASCTENERHLGSSETLPSRQESAVMRRHLEGQRIFFLSSFWDKKKFSEIVEDEIQHVSRSLINFIIFVIVILAVSKCKFDLKRYIRNDISKI